MIVCLCKDGFRILIQGVKILMISINENSREVSALILVKQVFVRFCVRPVPRHAEIPSDQQNIVFGNPFCSGKCFVFSFSISILLCVSPVMKSRLMRITSFLFRLRMKNRAEILHVCFDPPPAPHREQCSRTCSRSVGYRFISAFSDNLPSSLIL